MNKTNLLQNSLNVIAAIAIATWVGLILWASNRGFDITDEGFYMYKYSALNDSKITYTNFHLVQKFLFPFIEPTVQNLRIEKLLLCLAASGLFAFSIGYYLKNALQLVVQKKERLLLYFIILAGFSLTYSFGPQSPAYNFFSSFFITLASSLFIIDISKKQASRRVLLLYLFIGAVCEFLFLVKFSNAIIVVFVFIAFYLLYNLIASENKFAVIKQTLLRLGALIIGFLLCHLLFCGGFVAAVEFSKTQIADITGLKGYDKDILLATYLSTFTTVFDSLRTLKFILLSVTLIGIAWAVLKEKKYIFYSLLFIQLLIIIRFKLYYGGDAGKTEQTIVYFLWIITSLLILFINQKRNNTAKSLQFKQQLLFVLFLLFIPLAGALGTNNQLHIQIVFYMPFWMALLFILIQSNTAKTKARVIVIFIAFIAIAQSLDSVVNHSYRINGNLFAQNEKLNIGGSDLLVDKEYKENVVAIDSLLLSANLKSTDYLFYFSDVAGLGYVLNHHMLPVGNGWFSPDNFDYNCTTFKKLQETEPDSRLFLVLDSRYASADSLVKCWTDAKRSSASYYKVGEIQVSFSNAPHNLSIYAPR